MRNLDINQHLISGEINTPQVLPHYEALQKARYIFKPSFGLDELPQEPGLIIIRGARQYGKSTWLEQQIALTVETFGPGSALYLNGDEIKDTATLLDDIHMLIALFNPKALVKRLFIDEITAIDNWQKTLKRLIDAGELKDILIVTTGSRANDLRHGIERLPGRKGRLARNHYIFTPISYNEFKRVCGSDLGDTTLYAYLLSGGSPIAASAIATENKLPDYVTTIISDWILGEFAKSGRTRTHVLAVLQTIYRFGTSAVGQAKLARESGLSNNTVAQAYIDIFNDLMCILPSYPFDTEKNITLWRKPCKYQFINLLAAMTWHPYKIRTPQELMNAPNEVLGTVLEWAVAQELWRRSCIRETEMPEYLNFWQSKNHEIDFLFLEPNQEKRFIEVKKGKEQATNYLWFIKNHPQEKLYIINPNAFETQQIIGLTLEEFLLS